MVVFEQRSYLYAVDLDHLMQLRRLFTPAATCSMPMALKFAWGTGCRITRACRVRSLHSAR